jgi:16S rRNA (adenine1518-N6/adenine1519-N6)-dimethyltransferase
MQSIPLPGPGDEPEELRRPGLHRGSPPAAPAEIRTLLHSLGLKPQKGFGQNFLIDDRYLRRIAGAADLTREDVVLEVGPGLGHLTRHLAEAAGRVVAIEIDRGLVRELREMFQGIDNLEIIEHDVLDVPPESIATGHAYKVVANLPYYITSAALRHFLESSAPPSLLVVLLQREVAERILAPVGDLSLLAISIQVYGRPRLVTRVPANAFYPQPTVESAVLRIDVFPKPAIASPSEQFFKVVGAGFAMPRKQVHNSLAQRLWLPPGSAPDLLRTVGIDPTRRPQTLSVPEWDRLTQELMGRELV